MLDEADLLGGAGGVRAVRRGFRGVAGDRLAAGRADGWHGELALVAGAEAGDRGDDLRDHLAGTLDDDGVADANVLAVDVALVVEGGHADVRAANDDGLEDGERGEDAGAPDVDGDVAQLRGALLGRELERRGPTRLAADHAEPFPIAHVVDLEHDAIDVVVEALALVAPPLDASIGGVHGFVALNLGVDAEAHVAQPGEDLVLALRVGTVAPAELVHEDLERASGGDGRVLLAHGAGGSVTGVRVEGEGLAALAFPFFVLLADRRVHRFETALRHVDLAADFEALGERAVERLRNRADRAEVGGDVLALASVAAGSALNEAPVLVDHGHCEAIDFRLADEREAVADAVGYAALPGGEVVEAEGVAKAEERLAVDDNVERGEGRCADFLRRGIRRDELGVFALDGTKLVEERVVIGVRDLRRILLIVLRVVVVDLRAELFAAEAGVVLRFLGHGRQSIGREGWGGYRP